MYFIKQIFVIFLLLATGLQLRSQDQCSTYFPFMENTVMGYSYYNSKGKLTGKSIQTIKKVQTNSDGSVTATLELSNQDKKGRDVSNGSFEVSCVDNSLNMKISEIMSPNMKASLEGMEIDISGDAFILPSNLKEGQELPNTITKIKAGMNSITIITMSIEHSNRNVEAIEKVTTEAGTFQSIRFSYDVDIDMLIKKSYHIISWYSEEVGLVKQETYNKRGQLETKTELTGFIKGK